MRNSLLKFVELQDFAARFFIVADVVRKREFENRMNLVAFRPFAERVGFLDYETVSRYHSKAHAMAAFEKQVQLP